MKKNLQLQFGISIRNWSFDVIIDANGVHIYLFS